MERDNFYGDFMAKSVWRLSGVSWRKPGKTNCQTISLLILPSVGTFGHLDKLQPHPEL